MIEKNKKESTNAEVSVEKDVTKESLEEKLKKCEEERDEYLNGWKRAKADFINYKKEESERLQNQIRRQKEGIMQELIYVLDSFDLSLLSTKGESVEKRGVEMIRNQLYNAFQKEGLERIRVEIGEEFDPGIHEIVEKVDSDKPLDTIVEETEKGYLFKNKVLRPSKVKVPKRKDKQKNN